MCAGPGVALKLLQVTQQPDYTLGQITSLIEADPALAGRILQMANSSFVHTTSPVGGISQAVVLLGIRTVTRLALCFSLVENNRRGQCSVFPYDLFWSDSLARAVGAKNIIFRIQAAYPDEAFTAGLLNAIGKLAFASAYPETYAKLLASVPLDDSLRLAECEREQFGIDHVEVAACLVQEWGLPTEICDAIRGSLAPERSELKPGSRTRNLARALQLAALISSMLTGMVNFRERLAATMIHSNRLGIPPRAMEFMFDSIRDEWREIGVVLSLRTQPAPSLTELHAQAQEALQSMDADTGTEKLSEVTHQQ